MIAITIEAAESLLEERKQALASYKRLHRAWMHARGDQAAEAAEALSEAGAKLYALDLDITDSFAYAKLVHSAAVGEYNAKQREREEAESNAHIALDAYNEALLAADLEYDRAADNSLSWKLRDLASSTISAIEEIRRRNGDILRLAIEACDSGAMHAAARFQEALDLHRGELWSAYGVAKNESRAVVAAADARHDEALRESRIARDSAIEALEEAEEAFAQASEAAESAFGLLMIYPEI